MVGVLTVSCTTAGNARSGTWTLRLNGAQILQTGACARGASFSVGEFAGQDGRGQYHGGQYSDVYLRLASSPDRIERIALRLRRIGPPLLLDLSKLAAEPAVSYLSDDIVELRLGRPGAPGDGVPCAAQVDWTLASVISVRALRGEEPSEADRAACERRFEGLEVRSAH
ncbi:MAG TPA: hypothetical protein VI168_12715 [Croceibacterium sp.]